jgi:hypothetical protein
LEDRTVVLRDAIHRIGVAAAFDFRGRSATSVRPPLGPRLYIWSDAFFARGNTSRPSLLQNLSGGQGGGSSSLSGTADFGVGASWSSQDFSVRCVSQTSWSCAHGCGLADCVLKVFRTDGGPPIWKNVGLPTVLLQTFVSQDSPYCRRPARLPRQPSAVTTRTYQAILIT